jgi:neural Wiskott-Aldrich syndrome protein
MIADDLSRIAMSPGLGATLARAVERARAQGHIEVTLEHILLALCEDPEAGLVLAASNIDVTQLTSSATGALAQLHPHASPGGGADPGASPDLRRILEAATAAARGGRRREINGAIVLAAIIGDGKSAAAQILQAQGLTFEGAIRALQQAPAAANVPARTQPGTSTEQLLASARERVQSRTIHSARKSTAAPDEDEDAAAGTEAASNEPGPAVEDAAPPAAEREQQYTYERPPVPKPSRVKLPGAREPEPFAAPEPKRESKPAPAADTPPAKEPPREPPPKLSTRLQSLDPPSKSRSDRSAMSPPAGGAPPPQPAPAQQPPAQQPGEQAGAPPPAAPPQANPPAPPTKDSSILVSAAGGPPPIPAAPPGAGWGATPGAQAPPQAPNRMRPPPPPAPPPLPSARPGGEAARPGRPGPPPMERGAMGGAGPGPGPGHAGSSSLGSLAAQRRAGPPSGPMPGPQSTSRAMVPAPRAELGQLAENIPRTMRVAVQNLVEVRIAKAEVKALAQGLQGGGAAYQHEVTITKAMSVRLRAPDGGFYIETASPETQWIEKSMLMGAEEFASWRWHVTPRQKGKKRLQLIISARTVGADGLAAETAMPDQVVTVKVRTNYGRVFGHWAGWGVAAAVGGLLARFGEGAFDAGQQIISKFMAG